MQMRLGEAWRGAAQGRARLGCAMRLPRHVLPSAAAATGAARCRRSHTTDLFYPSSALPPYATPDELAVDDAPTEMLGLPLLLIALLHLTISGSVCGLHARCVASPAALPSPPLPRFPLLPHSLRRKLPSHLPTATLYANYFYHSAG